ncbi:hypothetical protein [Sphingomonas sp. CFBP 8760]|uniref:hypothetical protein n=1 Tax=Sphingomonas sp. CFBP 8760 TaxID=2775282 RepID=UPI0017849147|nr:hypothetical protein [Sphingomonas sp. CFBP 8760]MBD8548529.1 hypothetical protein [Sphingomonas sp. CFBP 8760]
MSANEHNVIEIDIATRIIADDEDMYVIRPGASFSLYDDFQREDAIFLDFPDLPLSLEKKPKATVALREIVARSIEIRDWRLGKRSSEPSRDQADYKGKASNRRIGAYVGAIQRLYYDLPIGAVLIIPSKTYIGDVLFAEISGPVERRKAVRAYPGEDMMVRPVRWLGRKQKASLSPALRGAVGRPTPVMQIERSLREEVAKAAFKQFVFQGINSTKVFTTSQDFSTLDDFNIQLFNNYVAGLLAAEEASVQPGAELHIQQALAFLRERRDLVPELDQSISSPGFQRIYNDHIAPLVIGALMTAALSGAAFAQTTEIRVRNSAMLKKDPCAVQVEERARNSMRLAHFDEFKEMCEALKETKKETGLNTSMHASTHKGGKK